MAEYPSNSYRSKELAKTEGVDTRSDRKMEKVVNGKVTIRENKSRKLIDMFISEDAGNIKDYAIRDILVPGIKRIASDILKDSIDMLFGNGLRSGNGSRSSKVNYHTCYNGNDSRFSDRREPETARGRFRYEDIRFETRGDAEAVRRQMIGAIKQYGMATVGDMYDMAGEQAPYTSYDYGWMSSRIFETAEIVRTRDGGYIMRLPNASPID